MEMTKKVNLFIFTLFFLLSSSYASNSTSWVGSKYQIECTMCAACDNPCSQVPSPPPPPPTPSPPPPSPPPATPTPTPTTSGCPPPPSPPNSGYYYSPPPPSQQIYPTYTPPPDRTYPTPAPPNPIMPYYPFYFYSPKPPSSAAVKESGSFVSLLLIVFFFC